MTGDYRHHELTQKVIGAAYRVHNTLGHGFAEKVYENALALELKGRGHDVRIQAPIEVTYRGAVVGDYQADLIVDGKVIVEIKAVRDLNPAHEVQLVNYLKATGIKVGLLINFGTSVKVKRRVFDP
jgi:GxxExxY protein